MSDSDCIRVFSLNCWGLKYISKHRVLRIDAIAAYLASARYDIVCLQELFVTRDFEAIRTSVSTCLPFYRLFHGGAFGQGLAIFSRYSIVSISFQPYSLNGSPLDLKGADWFAGKGVASVVVIHPTVGKLEIFNTHFFSEGGDDGPEHRRAHRLVSAWQFAKLIKQSAENGHCVIAAGDLNSIPPSLTMTVVRQHAGVDDPWAALHPPPISPQVGEDITSPKDAISQHGFTYNSPLNSYSQSQTRNGHPQGQRIDYILFRNAAHPPRTSGSSSPETSTRLVPTESRVVLTDLVPSRSFSYSDHFGVEVTFKIEHQQLRGASEEPHLTSDSTSQVLDALKMRRKCARGHAQLQRRVWIACIVALVGLLVGPAWYPTGLLTPLFVFLGAWVTWFGTTMFYVGSLYGGWETSALQNAIAEIELYGQRI